MTEQAPFNTAPLPVKLRIEDYLLLDGSGAFADYAKTELIDGEVFYMNAQHRPHALVKMKLYDALRDGLRTIRSPLRPLVEASIAIPPHSAPEPDIVLTGEPDGEGLVPLASVALVVEVSDTSLKIDMGRKAAMYAAAGIAEYWVVDLGGCVVRQFWSPGDAGYASAKDISFGDRFDTSTIDGLVADTADF
jgi:Uma2 family endonuclease